MSSLSNFCSIDKVPVYLKIADALHLNLALAGAHGRGKTAFINQYADKNGYELITINLSQMTPEDMIGIPVLDKNGDDDVSKFRKPDWLIKSSTPGNKVLLFFDELNNGEDDVQASILNLLGSRESGGCKLNDNTMIVAAFNPPEIAPNGRTFSKATRDRLCVIPLSDNVAPYKKYYESNGMTLLSSFLSDMGEVITDYSEDCEKCAYDNAEFTYRSLENCYKICEYVFSNNISKDYARVLCRGYSGPMNGDAIVSYYEENFKDDSVITQLEKSDLSTIENIDNILSNLKVDLDKMNFSEAVKIMKIIERVAPKNIFEEYINTRMTKEFVVAYMTAA